MINIIIIITYSEATHLLMGALVHLYFAEWRKLMSKLSIKHMRLE